MNFFWIKYFIESSGERTVLTELTIKSWNNSRMESMTGAAIMGIWGDFYYPVISMLNGPGRYHQSDDIEYSFSSKESKILTRRLQFFLPGSSNWLTKEAHLIDENKPLYREYISPRQI